MRGTTICGRCGRSSLSETCYRCRSTLKRNPHAGRREPASRGICPRCNKGPRRIRRGLCDPCHKAVAEGRALEGSPEHREKLRLALGSQRGPNNRNWRGERRPNAQGYVTVLVDEDDAIGIAMLGEAYRARGQRHILEHRLVMAHELDRPLTSREVVHHVNGDRADNRIENLRLMASKSEHARAIHHAECPHCGTPLR